MLKISTIPEALTELGKLTTRTWTDSEIFDISTDLGIELHAAAPISARVIVRKGLVNKFEGMPIREGGLAVLFPWQVGQLWVSGETITSRPFSGRNDREEDGEHILFAEPVRVTKEQVRIRAETLQEIFKIWQDAQSGRWVKDGTAPDGMRYHRAPDWMFPTDSIDTAISAIQQDGKQSKTGLTKQRIILAFDGLHFSDARWSKALGSPPDWLKPCRIMPGNKSTSALWNPVEIAAALLDKGISIKKLDAVFVELRDWHEEWMEKSEYFRM